MCIRDRGEVVRAEVERGPGNEDAEPDEEAAEVAGKAGVGPVSYTHLRAHETVLDLVCRLLLETKNDHGETAQSEIEPPREHSRQCDTTSGATLRDC